MQPAHPEISTHLTDRTFPELAVEYLPDDATNILLLCNANAIPPSFKEKLDAPEELPGKIKKAIREQADSRVLIEHCKAESRKELPEDIDSYDYTIHIATNTQVLQMHKPLYESSAVTRKGGTILYYNSRSIPDSDAVRKSEIAVLDWEDHNEPTLAAEMSVTCSGRYNPSATTQQHLVEVGPNE